MEKKYAFRNPRDAIQNFCYGLKKHPAHFKVGNCSVMCSVLLAVNQFYDAAAGAAANNLAGKVAITTQKKIVIF